MAAKKTSDSSKKSKPLPKASVVAGKSATEEPQTADKKVAKKKAKKSPAKKSEAKAEKKAAPAPKAAPKAAPAAAPKAEEPKKAAPPKPVYSPEQIYRMIEEEAYYIAERSGFARNPQDCWVEAEATIQLRVG